MKLASYYLKETLCKNTKKGMNNMNWTGNLEQKIKKLQSNVRELKEKIVLLEQKQKEHCEIYDKEDEMFFVFRDGNTRNTCNGKTYDDLRKDLKQKIKDTEETIRLLLKFNVKPDVNVHETLMIIRLFDVVIRANADDYYSKIKATEKEVGKNIKTYKQKLDELVELMTGKTKEELLLEEEKYND